MTDQIDGRIISRALRKAMGEKDEPGTCRDCGGLGVVPDMAATREADCGMGVWQDCPSCGGMRRGGAA